MRIAFVAPFALEPKGTTSARMMPLAQALAGRGHLIRVVVPAWDDPSVSVGEEGVDWIGIHSREGSTTPSSSVSIVTLGMPKERPRTLALTYKLVQWALQPPPGPVSGPSGSARHSKRDYEFRPEVVHVFKPVGYSGLAGFALSGLRVPWVLDTDDWEGPGGWADVNPYSPAQKLALTVQDALLPRLAGAVTAASRTLEARSWSFGLPRERVFYMPNGVWGAKYGAWARLAHGADTVQAPAPPEGVLHRGSVVLVYTRFVEFPYMWLLDILERVGEQHPEARMLVVGSGFFGEEDELRVEASRRDLDDKLVILGRVPEERLPAYLALGDVALYPMEDNLINRAKSPVKVLEPMLMGLPVVAHRVGQAAEFIGDAGVLVPPGDIEGLAGAVSALLSDRARCKRLGDKARERVWRDFNWEKLSLTAEAAYAAALGR